MSSSEEDSYSMIFASLKHPIRRKILRILSSEAQTFSDLQKQFNIESSHLTYHIEGLGNLLYKAEDGKYALSSLGEAAVSMMRNVEEPSTILHLPFTRRSRGIEKRIAGRTVAIALGLVCIVLAATLVGAFAYYVSLINDENNTISSLNALVSQSNINTTDLQNQLDALNLNLRNLQNRLVYDNSTINFLFSKIISLQKELNSILNWSSSITEDIMSDPSPWENKTVMIGGSLDGPLILPAYENLPYSYEVSSGNYTIGVSLNAKLEKIYIQLLLNTSYPALGASVPVMIYGTVVKGAVYWTGLSSEVTYYINAEAIVQLGPPDPYPPAQIIIVNPPK
jgi:DNA-binding transcriptional ArsR family regulator